MRRGKGRETGGVDDGKAAGVERVMSRGYRASRRGNPGHGDAGGEPTPKQALGCIRGHGSGTTVAAPGLQGWVGRCQGAWVIGREPGSLRERENCLCTLLSYLGG